MALLYGKWLYCKTEMMKNKEIENLLDQCILVDPMNEQEMECIPDSQGIFLFVLRKGCNLPDIGISPVCHKYKGLDVLYAGISEDLNNRVLHEHFGKDASISTLRKSLGSIRGLTKMRKGKSGKSKTKFTPEDEATLSEWMKEDFELYYCSDEGDINAMKRALIEYFNPPLNLQENRNVENQEFRAKVSSLRSNR